MDDDDERPKAKGYILFNKSRNQFMHETCSTNRHDTWQAGTAGNTRSELVKAGWECVPCVVSL